jgi:hypothetical protein
MTQKKKAELQRKLSMAPVTRPPGDLLARLKNDIPSDLMNTQRERERVSRSLSFNLRVAAAIVVMIGSSFALVQFLSQGEMQSPSLVPVAARSAPAPVQAPAEKPQAMADVTLTVADDQTRGRYYYSSPFEAKPAAQPEMPRLADASTGRRRDAPPVAGVAAGTVSEVAKERNEGYLAANAPPPPPAAAPRPVPAEAPVAGQKAAVEFDAVEEVAAPASASLVREARANTLSFAAPQTIFGISVDSNEFGRLKNLIEKGQTPEANEVNVEALVNHFAGAAPPRRDVRLQVEGSRAPLAGESMVVRYTIDTAESTSRGSLPPAATNARLSIELNPKVVANYRLLTEGTTLNATERTLLMNLSATGLIEVELQPDAKPRDAVATVRLRYHSVRDGREHPLVKTIYVRELRRTWIEASRRHRLATLGAVWGESLKGKAATASDVARRAEELATEAPADDRARDLANAASASSRLQTSGPTGSGR